MWKPDNNISEWSIPIYLFSGSRGAMANSSPGDKACKLGGKTGIAKPNLSDEGQTSRDRAALGKPNPGDKGQKCGGRSTMVKAYLDCEGGQCV